VSTMCVAIKYNGSDRNPGIEEADAVELVCMLQGAQTAGTLPQQGSSMWLAGALTSTSTDGVEGGWQGDCVAPSFEECCTNTTSDTAWSLSVVYTMRSSSLATSSGQMHDSNMVMADGCNSLTLAFRHNAGNGTPKALYLSTGGGRHFQEYTVPTHSGADALSGPAAIDNGLNSTVRTQDRVLVLSKQLALCDLCLAPG
jgi:hypothetical protein